MLLKNRLNKVKTFLNNNNVLAKLEERYCYSCDASNMKTVSKIPDLVVFVETIEDVQKILKYANEHEIPVVARGAGTNMVGACLCTEGGIVLNFSKMNKILDFNSTDMTIRVQPGVVLGDLKSYVDNFGLFYPPDPSNYKVSTIGGSIAQSSGGAMAFKYGTTKDYVLSIKAVKADGTLMKLGADTVKDACGYHLNQLIVGSEGTLAIVVEAVLKLIPKPEAKRTVCAYFNNVEDAIKAVDEIIKEHIFPSSVDFMDKNSIQTVEDFAKLGLDTTSECLLLVDIDGCLTAINSQLNTIENIFKTNLATRIDISNDDEESENIWQARRVSFAAATRLAPDVLSDDIIVPRRNISNLVKIVKDISTKYGLKICLVGHVGDGNLHPQVALNLDDENEFKAYMQAKSEIYSEVIRLGGTISSEHGVGVEKISYLENTIDKNVIEMMKLIKKAFDPKNILNPGKIFKL